LEWSGPVVALSVKTDLLAATVAARRRRGEVRVFDPTGATDEPGCTWSPLRAAHRYGAARQSAAALVEATDPHAPGEARFWNDQAVDLLGALMFLAAADGHGMDDLVQWVVTMARPGSATGCPPEMVLQRLEASDDHDLVADARRARRQLTGIWSYEERQFSAVYATARTMVARWDDPVVAASARGPSVDWAWLTDGGASGDRANTLYLCAPLHRPQQLAPVLGGLLADLIEQAYRRPLGTASAPDPVLVVIDEAGNWPVRNLPAVAATAAGVGLQLLVVFQSKAQIDAAYGAQADTLVSNCITKVIFSGVSDPTSATYASALVGDEHVVQHQRTRGPRQGATVSDSTTRLALVAPTVLRQMRPGEALLVHNTLPPAHLRARQWFRDAHLCALAGVAPPRRSPRGRRSPP
jgi:type IV secretion system protein VirD4